MARQLSVLGRGVVARQSRCTGVSSRGAAGFAVGEESCVQVCAEGDLGPLLMTVVAWNCGKAAGRKLPILIERLIVDLDVEHQAQPVP
jgi:hypothetical protein